MVPEVYQNMFPGDAQKETQRDGGETGALRQRADGSNQEEVRV